MHRRAIWTKRTAPETRRDIPLSDQSLASTPETTPSGHGRQRGRRGSDTQMLGSKETQSDDESSERTISGPERGLPAPTRRRLPLNWTQNNPLEPAVKGRATEDDGNLLMDVFHFGTLMPNALVDLAYQPDSAVFLLLRRSPEFRRSCTGLPRRLPLADVQYQRLAVYLLSRPELRVALSVLVPVVSVYNVLLGCCKHAWFSGARPEVCALLLRSRALCCTGNRWSQARDYIKKAISLSENNVHVKAADTILEQLDSDHSYPEEVYNATAAKVANCEYLQHIISGDFSPGDGDDGAAVVEELVMVALLYAARSIVICGAAARAGAAQKKFFERSSADMENPDLMRPLRSMRDGREERMENLTEGLNILEDGRKRAVQWFGSKHPLVCLCEAARYRLENGSRSSKITSVRTLWWHMWSSCHSRAAKLFASSKLSKSDAIDRDAFSVWEHLMRFTCAANREDILPGYDM